MIILESKVQIPVCPQQFSRRPRLREIIESNITQSRLVLVCAPAGYGKTTLLADWAHASKMSVAWLSITREDDDVEGFLRYLVAAWEAIQPDIRQSAVGVLVDSSAPDVKTVLAAFLNAASQAQRHLVFVFDDYHLVQSAAIHEAVIFLLDHLPPNLHLVLSARAEPPLPLARYRAHHHLLEIRTHDLRCTLNESAIFLSQSMGLELPADRMAALHDNTEGWIAGLQLAALTVQHAPEPAGETPLVSGQHRFIADYLAEDVLKNLPADKQDFLLQTSFLDHLCGSLCDAVMGRKDSQVVLEYLEKHNLFLTPLDARREWFRYHQLFADYLRQELTRRRPEIVAALHRRAARWYLSHDLAEEALRHAVAGDDAGLVIQIGEQYFEARLLSGETRVLSRWLDSLPEQWHHDYPLFGLFRAGVLLFTGALEDGARCIDEVERSLAAASSEDARWSLARVSAIRCSIACFQNDLARAESYAGRALRELPEEDHAFRAIIHHALGDTYRRNGLWEEARSAYLKVLDLVQAPAFQIRCVHVYGALADLELLRGSLRESAMLWRKALASIEERGARGTFPLPLIGWVYLRMGEILYQWNELVEAAHYLSEGLERSELGGDVRAMIAGYLLGARLKLTAGDTSAADDYLERVHPLVTDALFPDWLGRYGRLQIEAWLAQDRLRAAADWADEMLQDNRLEGQLESEAAQLAMARVLIVRGDIASLDQAKARLKHLIEMAQREGRMAVQIEALALRALARWRHGERPDAMVDLENALRLASPEGYIRLFVDLGLPMTRLLQEARSRGVMHDYVEILLEAFSKEFSQDLSAETESPMPEPLTPREQEVLELIAAGLTNTEIAERLVVSPETVKKHSGNIYGKLGVRSRTEAATRARELELLS